MRGLKYACAREHALSCLCIAMMMMLAPGGGSKIGGIQLGSAELPSGDQPASKIRVYCWTWLRFCGCMQEVYNSRKCYWDAMWMEVGEMQKELPNTECKENQNRVGKLSLSKTLVELKEHHQAQFYEATITLIPKPNRYPQKKKRKLQAKYHLR